MGGGYVASTRPHHTKVCRPGGELTAMAVGLCGDTARDHADRTVHLLVNSCLHSGVTLALCLHTPGGYFVTPIAARRRIRQPPHTLRGHIRPPAAHRTAPLRVIDTTGRRLVIRRSGDRHPPATRAPDGRARGAHHRHHHLREPGESRGGRRRHHHRRTATRWHQHRRAVARLRPRRGRTHARTGSATDRQREPHDRGNRSDRGVVCVRDVAGRGRWRVARRPRHRQRRLHRDRHGPHGVPPVPDRDATAAASGHNANPTDRDPAHPDTPPRDRDANGGATRARRAAATRSCDGGTRRGDHRHGDLRQHRREPPHDPGDHHRRASPRRVEQRRSLARSGPATGGAHARTGRTAHPDGESDNRRGRSRRLLVQLRDLSG